MVSAKEEAWELELNRSDIIIEETKEEKDAQQAENREFIKQIYDEYKQEESINLFNEQQELPEEDVALVDSPDPINMSELDEIEQSYNDQFYEAAQKYIEAVDLVGQLKDQKKNKNFVEDLTLWFQDIQRQSKIELDNANTAIKNEGRTSYKNNKLQRSAKFAIFAGALIEKCTNGTFYDQFSNRDIEDIFQAIMRDFLKQTVREAGYLLKEMESLLHEVAQDAQVNIQTTRENFGQTITKRMTHPVKLGQIQEIQNEDDEDGVQDNIDLGLDQNDFNNNFNLLHTAAVETAHNQTNFLGLSRKQDIYTTKEESVYKLFNLSVFKLAMIFERVRLYQHDIVQPRDNRLNVIEVNLDNNSKFNMIWEKNDFITTYQVLQIINDEILRIQNKNIEKNLFQETILKIIDTLNKVKKIEARQSRKLSDLDYFISESQTKLSSKQHEKEMQEKRTILQAYFLQDQTQLFKKAYSIHMDQWSQFTANTTSKLQIQQKKLSVKSMEQEVFLYFTIELNTPQNPNKNFFRTFQLELMYQSQKPISQKAKFKLSYNPLLKNGQNSEFKFLFLQVPFKLIMGTEVFMIIKVFKNYVSNSGSELESFWTQKNSPNEVSDPKSKRNIYKIYEGFTLVSISDAFWRKNLVCGQNFEHQVHMYYPDPVQVVDDRYIQIYREKSFAKNLKLQEELNPRINYSIMSNLAIYEQELDLREIQVVMQKRYMKTYFQSRDINTALFLKNDPCQVNRTYTNDQFSVMDQQLKGFVNKPNEIKLDLHSLIFQDQSLIKQPLVRLQVFLRHQNIVNAHIYDQLSDGNQIMNFSYETMIAQINQKCAPFRETCFIRIPTKEYTNLKDYCIVIAVQFPILASMQFQNIDRKNGTVLDRQKVIQQDQERMGIVKDRIEYNHISTFHDRISFKTEYVCVLPLFDERSKSLINAAENCQAQMLKFEMNNNDFSTLDNQLFSTLKLEKGFTLHYSIDVMSHCFFHERALNAIINLYENKKSNLSAANIWKMLKQLKQIQRNVLVHNVEKLLNIFFGIFATIKDIESSNYAWEAILFIIDFFQKDKHLVQLGIVKEYIRGSSLDNITKPIYPKVLFHLLQFSKSLDKSIQTSKPVGTLPSHFPMFKYLPIICEILKKSFINEQRMNKIMQTTQKNDERQEKRKQRLEQSMRASQHQQRTLSEIPFAASVVKTSLTGTTPPTASQAAAGQNQNINDLLFNIDTIDEYQVNQKVSLNRSIRLDSIETETQDIEPDGPNPDVRKNQPINLEKHMMSNGKIFNDTQNKTDLRNGSAGQAAGNIIHNPNKQMNLSPIREEQATVLKSEEAKMQPVREPIEVENFQVIQTDGSQGFDELINQSEGSFVQRLSNSSGFKTQIHPNTNRILIKNNEVLNQEKLLEIEHGSLYDLPQILQIILTSISQNLHKENNKSVFALRMIYYSHLVGILSHLIEFMSQEFILEILRCLVKPLHSNVDQKQQSQTHLNDLMGIPEESLLQSLSEVKPQITDVKAQQDNFWVSNLIDGEVKNQNEFVRRVITMGQFLESKAIEKLPNNPYLGRYISKCFNRFISETAGDQATDVGRDLLLFSEISSNLKAHTLLYFMHQVFKHENRFAQLYDLKHLTQYVHPAKSSQDFFDEKQNQFEQKLIENNASILLIDLQESYRQGVITEQNRSMNRRSSRMVSLQSESIFKQQSQQLQVDQAVMDLQQEGSDRLFNNRLAYFIRDCDLYTAMLLQITQEQLDDMLPEELRKGLEPRKEKCQLIIFQLICLVSKSELTNFMPRKRQLRAFLQNVIEIIDSDHLEFREPFTLYGGEKKQKVFEQLTRQLCSVMTSQKVFQIIMSYKRVYRPILSSVWTIQLLIYKNQLKAVHENLVENLTSAEYNEKTWNIFGQLQDFWRVFMNKNRVLVLSEENEKLFQNKIITSLYTHIKAELKLEIYFTLTNTLRLLLFYESEYFGKKIKLKMHLLTQLVRLSQIFRDNCKRYQEELDSREVFQPNYNSFFYEMLKKEASSMMRDQRQDFIVSLQETLDDFKQIEYRILMVKYSDDCGDLLYKAFARYELLKIYLNKNLDYKKEIITSPFDDFKNHLKRIQKDMQAREEDDGLFDLGETFGLTSKKKVQEPTNKGAYHLKVELAFTEIKMHEIVERKYNEGQLDLGTLNTELQIRVERLQEACNQLRHNRFFLMAIEFKEREKKLLMQLFKYGGKDDNISDSEQIFSVFKTLKGEEAIHQDIKTYKESVKSFCVYYYLRFFGEKLPLELKHQDGFIIRALPSQGLFSLRNDLSALYDNKITLIQDVSQFPEIDCPGIACFVQKLETFTMQERKLYNISANEKGISESKDNDEQERFSVEFSEYFNQNFKKQFFQTEGVTNKQIEESFLQEARNQFREVSGFKLGFSDTDLLGEEGDPDELNKSQTSQYFANLNESMYGKSVTNEQFEKFWGRLQDRGKLTNKETVTQENLLKASVEQWKIEANLQFDVKITILEVDETFPTMYFMQKVEKKLVKYISGVEQQIIFLNKRLDTHSKIRTKVKHIYNHTNKVDSEDIYQEKYKDYLSKVGPINHQMYYALREDVDAEQNGGVQKLLKQFFPNEMSIQRLSEAAANAASTSKNNQKTAAEERFRQTLKLFVTIETWFSEVQQSLVLFGSIYDDYESYLKVSNKDPLGNVISTWQSKLKEKKEIFEQIRVQCRINDFLLELEDNQEFDESDY